MPLPILSPTASAIAQLHAFSEGDTATFQATVETIRQAVLEKGDAALVDFAAQFDKIDPQTFILTVSKADIQAAYQAVSPDFLAALQHAKTNIEAFHVKQRPHSFSETTGAGITSGLRYSALDRAGLYVPGGRALYPSTVLMNAIPATVAGVRDLVMVTPPKPDGSIDPTLLVAADLCGVTEIYKVGGAQAVFALAYGTSAIAKVDKIVGPGNTFVTLAKQRVYGVVDIDKPAGPSEVLVYVDDVANAKVAAAELLAQLEHDPHAIAVGLSISQPVLEAVNAHLEALWPTYLRKDIIAQSLKNSVLFKADSEAQALEVINAVASEHLVLLTENAEAMLPHIRHAGSIFMGLYTPVTLGDYFAGPNHVLPTSGTARFASPLGVMDFMKFSTHLCYPKAALQAAASSLKTLTDAEGFEGHYRAVEERL
ncbi:MAG: histidinol dehydrogenase [Candidatus Margulisiibacteriota bacterium]